MSPARRRREPTDRRAAAWRCALIVLLCAFASTAQAATRYDPAYRFQTIRTRHFSINFHQREEPAARRLAAIAEQTWERLRHALDHTPPPLTDVVLVDQSEVANGFAFPLPYDTIQITATWPSGSDFIGNTDDWLRLAFTHEFTHIVHLDQSAGWARRVRAIFGRSPLAFPNVFLPAWQLEGLAAFEESAITSEGRLHAGDFQAIVGEAARGRTLEPLDRVNGGLTDWPQGGAPYAYGLGFHAYLADRFGTSKLAELATGTGSALPFLGSRAFRRVFGEPLGDLWHDYETHATGAAAPPSGQPAARRVTRHGFGVAGPRFVEPPCATCPQTLVYAVSTPHGFPTLNAVHADGSSVQTLAWRYRGSTTGVGRSTLYFDQQEVARNTGLYADLYALDRATRRVTRLTTGARLEDPDLSPDERTLVCVRESAGHRDLVLVDVAALRATAHGTAASAPRWLTVVASGPETQFNTPRWSPDGAMIAVERHRPGQLSEVVVFDVASRRPLAEVAAPRARVVTPAWRPDGRAVVVAAAPDGEPFNLVEADINAAAPGAAPRLRQLTFTTGGAAWPDVSRDGRTIAFVGYTVDGFDLFTMPYPATSPSGSVAVESKHVPAPTGATASEPASTYAPWRTLAPTSWSPTLTGDRQQLRVGATIAATDLLGYHSYSLSASWLASSPAGAERPPAITPDWQVAYVYDRWWPTFWAGASSDTSFFAGPATASGAPSSATLRERRVEGGVLLPVRRLRWTAVTLASLSRAVDDYTLPDRAVSVDRTAVRGGVAYSNAHSYGYSISPEGGITVGVTAEAVRRALGSDGNASTFTTDVRAYLPGLGPHHVTALRAAFGGSTGDGLAARAFHLGGALPNVDPLSFDREAISLLRGFPADTFAGSHVALVNAEYRWPLARPQRGVGTWPVFLHTLHAAVFADAGSAWLDRVRAGDLKTSAGAELSARLVAGYYLPLLVTVGAAWGHDGSGRVADGTTFFVRIGRAF